MCGIAAIFNYRNGQPVDRGELGRVLAHMQRRGPDGSGEWYGPGEAVGLGHRRLSIIDLSDAGAQPMASADGRILVTFNGEIYNYRELRAELEAKGRRFRSQSDTEVLLHLYELEGESMLCKLRGMYAFAIWDEPRRGLFLARDPFGIKPLYYSDDGHTLRVASQVKALLAGGHCDTSPEPAGHVGFFLWGHIPAPYTLYKGIRALPAGASLWVDRNGPGQIREFLSVTTILSAAEQSQDQLSTLNPHPAQLLRSALSDSVRHHLIADVPVGVFLSSGLDSSTITALAAESSASLRTVTLGFEEFRGTINDETPLAEQVAAQYGARHQTIWVNKQDFRDNFPRLMQAMDQPSCDGVNSFFISHAAAQAGLKVALSGLGGDELFGGYPSFREIPRAVRAFQHFSLSAFQLFGRAFRVVTAPVLKRLTSPKYAGLLEYGGSYGGAFLLRRGMFMPWELPEVLDADLVRDGWAQLQTLVGLEETTNGIKSSYLKIAALEMCWYMRAQLLRDTDWASMDHSLEVRTPLVDVELLRKLAPLLAGGHPPTKRDMALSPSIKLPPAILHRPKTGFSVPVRQWLVQEDRRFQLDRGLRGWTRLVYSAFMADRGESLHLTRAALGRRVTASARLRSPVVSSSCSPVVSPSCSPVVPSSCSLAVPKRILVFRIGQLGDTIVALPALWALKHHFPAAEFTLLCDRHPGKAYVFGPDLFQGQGFFKQFEFYPVRAGRIGQLRQGRDMLQLLARLRQARFDTLAYLSPSTRTRRQIARDMRFFRAAGIKHFIGTEGFAAPPTRTPGRPLDEVPHEAELLLARLAASGIPVPPPGQGCMELSLGAQEDAEVEAWLEGQQAEGGGRRTEVGSQRTEDRGQRAETGGQKPAPRSQKPSDLCLPSSVPADHRPLTTDHRPLTTDHRPLTTDHRPLTTDHSSSPSRPWIGFGPGSKMPAKQWPLDRFIEVGQSLIEKFDVWPVVFGGAEDADPAARLIEAWGRGHNAAGRLSVRAAALALKRCLLYIGNDTGTMHLAAAVNTRCVAIFSAREWPGRWYPYGPGHRVFRTQIACEGCGLVECLERKNECLRLVSAAAVSEACEAVLGRLILSTADMTTGLPTT